MDTPGAPLSIPLYSDMTFRSFCAVMDAVRRTRRTDDRERLFQAYLDDLPDASVRLMVERFARTDALAGTSSAVRTEAVCRYLGLDSVAVFEPCRRATGNVSEAQRLLMANLAPVPDGPALSVADADALFQGIRSARNRASKVDALLVAFRRMGPDEAPVFLRLMGPTVPGFGLETVNESVRTGTHATPGTVRAVVLYASAATGWRGGALTEFTLGVDVREDPRFEDAYIPIGKAAEGTDAAILADLARLAASRVAETFGPTCLLHAEITVEAVYEGIVSNRRTKAGLVLHKPRITAILGDGIPPVVDSLHTIERLHTDSFDPS